MNESQNARGREGRGIDPEDTMSSEHAFDKI